MPGMIKWHQGKSMVCIIIWFVTPVYGQMAEDARSLALGHIASASGDYWAAGNNPAGLGEPMGWFAGISILNKYLIEDMHYSSFLLSYTTENNNGFGLAGSFSGFQYFTKQWYAISYGRKFSTRISSGISLIYSYFNTPESSAPLHAATYKIGINVQLGQNVRLSYCGINPFGLSYSSRKTYSVPSLYFTGLEYRAYENLIIEVELDSDSHLSLVFKGGMEYSFRNRFFMRVGAMSCPFRFTSGTGFVYQHFVIDIATEYHSILGFSPALSLTYHP